MRSRSRSIASVGFCPTGWNGAMKVPKRIAPSDPLVGEWVKSSRRSATDVGASERGAGGAGGGLGCVERRELHRRPAEREVELLGEVLRGLVPRAHRFE